MELLRAGLMLGASTALRMAANLVIIKVIAVQLGPEGMGVIGQFMSVIALTSAIAGGGIALGIAKHVSQGRASGDGARPHLHAAAVTWLVTSLLFGLGVAVNATTLSELLLGTPIHSGVFVALAGGQAAIGASNLLIGVLNGRHDVRGVAVVQTLSAVTGAVITTALVLTAGLAGALWGLLLGPSVGAIFAILRVLRGDDVDSGWIRARARPEHYRDLLRFAVMLGVTVCTMPFTQIMLRTWQAEALGWHQAGVWQGLVKLSDAWLQLPMLVLSTWYFPRLSSARDHAALHAEVRRIFLVFVALLVPAAMCIWALRAPIVALLFAPDFESMRDLLAPQLAGDVLRALSFVIAYVAVAKAQTGLYVAAELFQAGMVLLLSQALLPRVGASAVPYAYLCTTALYLLLCVVAYHRFRVARRSTLA